jgi:hypothetical protein
MVPDRVLARHVQSQHYWVIYFGDEGREGEEESFFDRLAITQMGVTRVGVALVRSYSLQMGTHPANTQGGLGCGQAA